MFHNDILKVWTSFEQVKVFENLPPIYLPYRLLHDNIQPILQLETDNIWFL